MFELLLLVTAVQVLRDDGLDADAVLPIEGVVLAVALVVHVVRADVASDLGVFIHPFQFLAFGVAIVLKRDGVVGQAKW